MVRYFLAVKRICGLTSVFFERIVIRIITSRKAAREDDMSEARWKPIETARSLDRVIVAGWQPRSGSVAGYWWYHEDVTDEDGKPIEYTDALLWHPFPEVPREPPATLSRARGE